MLYYIPDSGFHEEVLGNSRSGHIHEALSFVLRMMEVDLETIVAITTDWGPFYDWHPSRISITT